MIKFYSPNLCFLPFLPVPGVRHAGKDEIDDPEAAGNDPKHPKGL